VVKVSKDSQVERKSFDIQWSLISGTGWAGLYSRRTLRTVASTKGGMPCADPTGAFWAFENAVEDLRRELVRMVRRALA